MMMSKAQVAELFHIRPRTVEHWVKLGRIPRPLYIGRRALWHRDRLQTWVNARFAATERRGR